MKHLEEPVIGPQGHDYTRLAGHLGQLKGEKVVYVQNPGNAGDAIIFRLRTR